MTFEQEITSFWMTYAKNHYRFTAAAVLEHYSNLNKGYADKDKEWKAYWVAMPKKLEREGAIFRAVKAYPIEQAHSHVGFGALWQSRIFEGDTSSFDPPEVTIILDAAKKWKLREFTDIVKFTDYVYTLGKQNGYEEATSVVNKQKAVKKGDKA